MHLIYTNNPNVDISVYQARSPLYFAGVEASATKVTIDGDYPAIEAAYKDAGIEVEAASTPVETVENRPAPKKSTKKQ